MVSIRNGRVICMKIVTFALDLGIVLRVKGLISSLLSKIRVVSVHCEKHPAGYTRGRSKSSKPHTERRVIAEHFCCDKTQPLRKSIPIFVLISVQLKSMQSERFAENLKSG